MDPPNFHVRKTALTDPVKTGKRLAKRSAEKVIQPAQLYAFSRRYPAIAGLIREVRRSHLTFLTAKNLIDLSEAVIDAEHRALPGAIVEAGTALGGSALVLARSKSPARPLWVFDAFGMIPPPGDKDGKDVHRRYETIVAGKAVGPGGGLYYGYHEDLLGEVVRSFVDFGITPSKNSVTFVKGYYEDTLRVDFPVAVAHIDCDWYESVLTCLREIEPHVVPGGRFVIDDYEGWSGCKTAVDEFFSSHRDYRFVRKSRLHIVKRP